MLTSYVSAMKACFSNIIMYFALLVLSGKIASTHSKNSSQCRTLAILFLYLLPTASAAGSEIENDTEVLAAAAAVTAAAVVTVMFMGKEREVEVPNPILVRGGAEVDLPLPLPQDRTNFNYTKMEVIEMSITHTKLGMKKAITEWSKTMKERCGLGKTVQKFGPGLTNFKKFFPKKRGDPYPDEVVDDLLEGLEPDSEDWHERVEWIVSCKDHAPDKAGIYSRYSVEMGVDDNEALTAAAAVTDMFMENEKEVEVPNPILVRGGAEVDLPLPLPQDRTNFNYTKMEVIEMSITHTKLGMKKAITEWSKTMKERCGLGKTVQKFGPGLTNFKKFFPKKRGDPYPDEVVDDLLEGLEPDSEDWHERVEWIVSCKDHAPDKAGIYSRYSVEMGVDDNEDRENISSRTVP